MKIQYPEVLVPLNLSPDIDTKNSADNSVNIEPDDHLYLLDRLQKQVGKIRDLNPNSHDYRITALEDAISNLQTAIIEVSAVQIDSGSQIINAVGTVTVNLNFTMTTIVYIPNVSLISANGQRLDAVVQLPPLTDSRTPTSFSVDCADAGTLYWSIAV